MLSYSEVWEGIDKDVSDDWQILKARLKILDDRLKYVVFNQPLDSRVFFKGNSMQKIQFPTTPLMK